MKCYCIAALAAPTLLQSCEAFQAPICRADGVVSQRSCKAPIVAMTHQDEAEAQVPSRTSPLRKLLPVVKLPMAIISLMASGLVLGAAPQEALASPMMMLPQFDDVDYLEEAIQEKQAAEANMAAQERRNFNQKAREIEKREGVAAREKFEAEYEAVQTQKKQEYIKKLEKLHHDLLDQGICPFMDMEGQRQVFMAQKGIDQAKVEGTIFNHDYELSKMQPERSFAVQKEANRKVIQSIVADLKNRGEDPVSYFRTHQQGTQAILDLSPEQAGQLATKYQTNMDLYGQIRVPKEGEMSAKEKLAKAETSKLSTKEEAKRVQAEAKAKATAERAAVKAQAAAERAANKAKAAAERAESKARAKAERELARAEAKAEKEAAKLAKEAAKAAALSETVATSETDTVEVEKNLAAQDLDVVTQDVEAASSLAREQMSSPLYTGGGALLAVGAGGYAIKMMRNKGSEDDEEERRKFQLLMGIQDEEESTPTSPPGLDVELDLDNLELDGAKPKEVAPAPVVAAEPPKVESVSKVKRRGIKAMFARKRNNRETDISALVSVDAKAPEFATTLAKILTFGARGRFPHIMTLPGGSPMEEFNAEEANEILSKAQETAELSKEDAAEVFANVVNCMLIDIVDLASSALKEKESKTKVEAIRIVIDFMKHAESLYNAIAEGVEITAVTYGGELSKSKLEQMYSEYAVSGMTSLGSMDDDFQTGVELLQDVFQINEKKAEGLVTKAVQKNLMEMMKSGEGMEGMQEMMKSMGGEGMGGEGMGGMPGMPGMDGQEPDPEQLREMLLQLKEMKDSGSIPASQMEGVKEHFKKAFGSSIDDFMKDVGQNQGNMSDQDKELMELMHSILE